MTRWLACALLAAPVPSFAALVEAPAAPSVLTVSPVLAAPMLGAVATEAARPLPALSAVPSLSVFAAPASAAAASAAAAAPITAAAPTVIAPAARASAAAQRSSPAAETSADGARLFDGARAAAAAPTDASGWNVGSFESAASGTTFYKARLTAPGRAPRVYSGGLALNESFDPLFAGQAEAPRSQFFLWTRGHPPTAWTPTRTVIDADARDLARMIVTAAEQSRSEKVELALHSFGTLVFQRMVQLRGDPEIDRALALLSGSRVVLLNATTHYIGSERRAGVEFEAMGNATRAFVDWLDAADAAVDAWKRTVAFNPLLSPMNFLLTSQWQMQRDQLLALASRDAAGMMRKDLSAPWAAHDDIRMDFLKDLARDSKNPGWQESLLRRSSDMFRLEFTPDDAAYIRNLGIRLDLIHAAGDQLLNWESARILYERLGIEAPDAAPKPGTVLTDVDGRFRATIVDGDHYYPLKQAGALREFLDP